MPSVLWANDKTHDTPSSRYLVVTTAAVAALAVSYRTYLRSQSPLIRTQLRCECGEIQGTVEAKKEDSIQINCHCADCRKYAEHIAKMGNKQDKTIGQPHGDSRVVQVCKSAVHLHKGRHLLRLARKRPGKGFSQGGMHRFYAGCCYVPLMNTVSFLGFVGVFRDFLSPVENVKQYDGPVDMFPEEALAHPIPPAPQDLNVLSFLWKLVRYSPYTRSGPFNYSLEPTYWDIDKS